MAPTEAIIAYAEPGTRNIRIGRYNPYFMPHEIRKAVAARVIKHRIIFYHIPPRIMEKVYAEQSVLLRKVIETPELVNLSSPGPFIALFWEKITGIKSVSRDDYAYFIEDLLMDGSKVLDTLEQKLEDRATLGGDPSIATAPVFESLGNYLPDPDNLPLFTKIDEWSYVEPSQIQQVQTSPKPATAFHIVKAIFKSSF